MRSQPLGFGEPCGLREWTRLPSVRAAQARAAHAMSVGPVFFLGRSLPLGFGEPCGLREWTRLPSVRAAQVIPLQWYTSIHSLSIHVKAEVYVL